MAQKSTLSLSAITGKLRAIVAKVPQIQVPACLTLTNSLATDVALTNSLATTVTITNESC